MRFTITLLLGLFAYTMSSAQEFTLADTLRGTLSPSRSCFDVTHYDLHVAVDIDSKSISGVNHIHFKNVTDFDSLQIDLFENMDIDSIVFSGSKLNYTRLYNAVFVQLGRKMKKGEKAKISVYYHGTPIAAKNAPWDGGFVWKEDHNGKPFVGVACEGMGASSWWPNKDHLSDEPENMKITCTVPEGLMCVSNGELVKEEHDDKTSTWSWLVSYPINNYNVTLNIADYAHFSDKYINASDEVLKLDYYVLKDNLDKAKVQFEQVKGMMMCFEEAFGPYPFYKDGYALVETPYLGMEHQGAIAYGNKYKPGYLGRHPEGMDFDYIIIHETGHEWFGNSVSMNDMADMWIHESFTTYSESVYVEWKYGYKNMLKYLEYQRNFINNKTPIIGPHGVNKEGNSGDMYYKGAWMLHTLRNVLADDDLFKSIIKGIAQEFKHRTVDGEEVIAYINEQAGQDLSKFFEQYLENKDVPILEYSVVGNTLELKWKTEVREFQMPLELNIPSKGDLRVTVNSWDWTEVTIKGKDRKNLNFRDDLFLFIAKELD